MANTIHADVVSAEESILSGEAEFVVLEVQLGVITALADTAIRGHGLDEAKALEAQQRAREVLQNRTSQMEYAKAMAELAEAAAQIAAIRKLRKK